MISSYLRPAVSSITPYRPGQSSRKAIKLSSNENPYGTAPTAKQLMHDIVEGGDIDTLLSRYPDRECSRLRRQLADYHAVEPRQIVLGNGSGDLLHCASSLFLQAGRNGLMAHETFSLYNTNCRLMGADTVEVPLRAGHYDLPAMLDRVDGNTALIYLCNPNNPTGTIFGEDELRRFLGQIPVDLPMILDEAYADYCSADDYPDGVALTKNHPNLIVTRTFSKIYGLAALRLGYSISSSDIAEKLMRVRAPFSVNKFAQQVGESALVDRSFYNRCRKTNSDERQRLQTELKRIGLEFFPSQSNFIAINVGQPSQTAYDFFLQGGIAVRPLSSFHMENWIRYTIGRPQDNTLFIDLLNRYSRTV